MLSSISIRNVVLIDSLDIDFRQGLSVFTGETGAGKSIFLDSLMLTLGARADSSLIRHGQEKLSVSAQFLLPCNHYVYKLLEEQEIDFENGELNLRRTLNKDGKSKAFINDVAVSAGLLKQVGDSLVEIHGQFANHSLLNPSTHLEVLDRYAGSSEELITTKKAFEAWIDFKKQKEVELELLEQARKDKDFLQFNVAEIEALNPKFGEVEELEQKRLILMNTQKLTENLSEVMTILNHDNPEKLLSNALIFLEKASSIIPEKFDEAIQMLESARIEIGEASSNLEELCNSLELDSTSLPEIDDRLYAIKEIARKHKINIEDIPELLASFKNKLALVELGEDRIQELNEQEQRAKENYIKIAKELSKKRKEAGLALDKAVAEELKPLKLEKARFATVIEELSEANYNSNGIDKVSFMVSTNSGQPLSPINKTASGGELARFMLALKVNLANASPTVSLVFDEVDTGIGGATAMAVGQSLSKVAKDKQILVVTHSPQVASFGDNHYKIIKDVTTTCLALDESKRVFEIARMLAGSQITDEAISAAKALLKDNYDNR